MTWEAIAAVGVAGLSALGYTFWPKTAAAAKVAGLSPQELVDTLAKLRQHYATKRLEERMAAQTAADLQLLEATFGPPDANDKGA